ncbi:putative cell division protein [Helicobacter pylori Aklavik86]|uniref:Putative cell division protein n=1 Tax=Helicobacter pylori Aklavik86 TaxID=1055532 RepID=K7Y7D6_HELPX|nr:putative cell division protein [Helicobacter pylori Aklavik86]
MIQTQKPPTLLKTSSFLRNNLRYLRYFKDCNKRACKMHAIYRFKNHHLHALSHSKRQSKTLQKIQKGRIQRGGIQKGNDREGAIERYEAIAHAPQIEFLKKITQKLHAFLQRSKKAPCNP